MTILATKQPVLKYPYIFVHIVYACGHEAVRPIRQSPEAARMRWSYDRCSYCTDLRERRYTLQAEMATVPVPVEVEEALV